MPATSLRGSTVPAGGSVVLPLQWVADRQAGQVRSGALALLDACRHLTAPFDLRFALASRGGQLTAGLTVTGIDGDATGRAVQQVGELAATCLPWFGFGEPVALADTSLAGEVRPPAAARLTGGADTTLRVRAGSAAPAAHALARHDATVSCALGRRLDAGELQPCADVLITGTPTAVEVLAALLALEVSADDAPTVHTAGGEAAAHLVAAHGVGDAASLGDEALASLLSLPARSPDPAGWQRLPAPPAASGRLVGVLRAAPELHRWGIGRTGTGKSTLLEHLAAGDAADGKTLLVIDPHGTLATRLCRQLPADRAGDLVELDFAAADPPRYDLLAGEPGQPADTVVNDVTELLRQLFDRTPEDYFGPVFYRVARWALRVVVHGSRQPSWTSSSRCCPATAPPSSRCYSRPASPTSPASGTTRCATPSARPHAATSRLPPTWPANSTRWSPTATCAASSSPTTTVAPPPTGGNPLHRPARPTSQPPTPPRRAEPPPPPSWARRSAPRVRQRPVASPSPRRWPLTASWWPAPPIGVLGPPPSPRLPPRCCNARWPPAPAPPPATWASPL
jgi:hypothetical protein